MSQGPRLKPLAEKDMSDAQLKACASSQPGCADSSIRGGRTPRSCAVPS